MLKFTNFYQLSVEWQFLDKLKVHPVMCHEGMERAGVGEGRTTALHFNLGARCKWVVNISS